ncbi:hypothetical protein F383_06322 [Gossypium arboreum]|uniref:Uncharacterized protein n=1 Tax=Gossypium arboreum TaxID=29729 RepID=A0A0B0P3T4_GOSAR|nr:hypothetical protein F383_06322 [Gossypium arboreum]
MPIISDLARYC